MSLWLLLLAGLWYTSWECEEGSDRTEEQIAASLWWLKVIKKNHLIIRVWCRSWGALPQLYSRALMIASLASMLICTSALAASSDVPANADWAFSRLALAACKRKQRGISEKLNCRCSNRTGILCNTRGWEALLWKLSHYYWGKRQVQNLFTASQLWKLHLSQKWLERRNAKHSWKLKVSQWGFDTSAITQQWLTFSCLLTVRVRVSFHCRLESNIEGKKKKRKRKTHLWL